MRLPLSVQFWIWIASGAIALAFLVFFASQSICPTSSNIEKASQDTEKNHGRADSPRHLIDETTLRAIALAEANETNTKSRDAAPDNEITKTPYPLVCDAKGTDLALVYFTYCLVIVGWFGIRSNQLAVESLERAYLWPGFGNFDWARGKLHLGIRNAGRTVGTVTTVHHALLPDVSDKDFEAIKVITYKVYGGRENSFVPNPNVEIWSGVYYRRSEFPKITCGWITYVDIFGKTQRQGWKHRIRESGWTDSLPGCYTYKPWDKQYREERDTEDREFP